MTSPLASLDPGWAEALAPVAEDLERVLARVEADERGFLPVRENILAAFRAPFADVRVLIVGQDPYPTPGNAIGLSFAVDRTVRPIPASLRNMYAELHDDLGIAPAPHGDLTPWATQGVLLLNRVLTVAPRDAGSHRKWGWETITDRAITALVERDAPLVAVLWGNDAQTLAPMLGDTPTVASVHPSPLSARRGFFGSRPYSQVNALLREQGAAEIDWTIEETTTAADGQLF